MAASDEFAFYHHDHGVTEPRVRRWRENVGAPVTLDLAPRRGGGEVPRTVVVLSWNVWIGRGRLAEVVERIRSGAWAGLGAPSNADLVVLVQEAYRADPTVPLPSNGATGRAPFDRAQPGDDIVELARSLRLNLRYAPSMRNGVGASDRGNALLSTLPLESAAAFELPMLRQRRVAVSATARLPGGIRLRATSAHLDPRGVLRRDLLGVTARAAQAAALLAMTLRHAAADGAAGPLVLGADLNLARGQREPAFRVLADAGFTLGVPPRDPPWPHTFHAVPRLVLDYLLFQDPRGVIEAARVHRLDEHPRDAGRRVFGSDHHPLLATVELAPARRDAA